MKFALIQGERICQFAAASGDCFQVAPDLKWVEVADGATTSDTFVDGAVVSYQPPPPFMLFPTIITDRQFFQQLALMGVITQDEALAAVKTGAIPAALQAFIDGMPADQKFTAEMLVSGAVSFDRNHPMTLALAAGMGWTSQQVDDLWRAAAQL